MGGGGEDDEGAGFGDGGVDVGHAAIQIVGGVERGLVPADDGGAGGLDGFGYLQAIQEAGGGDADFFALVLLEELGKLGVELIGGHARELEVGVGGGLDEEIDQDRVLGYETGDGIGDRRRGWRGGEGFGAAERRRRMISIMGSGMFLLLGGLSPRIRRRQIREIWPQMKIRCTRIIQ